ncbi:carbonic anhydrase [Xylariaceae sp. FL0594]|nr:carbonic anhydrase [Xylariaceae sp. FL0594]
MPPSLASELVRRAEVISKGHTPQPYLSEIAMSPQKMMFCCLDRRVVPEKFLGLKSSDGVVLVRTASGTPARNILDIVAMDKLVGLSEVIVVKHTDCGALHTTDAEIRKHMIEHNPDLAGKVDDVAFQATTDIVERTRLDVEIIRTSPLIRKELREAASGLLYDIKTGKVSRIV